MNEIFKVIFGNGALYTLIAIIVTIVSFDIKTVRVKFYSFYNKLCLFIAQVGVVIFVGIKLALNYISTLDPQKNPVIPQYLQAVRDNQCFLIIVAFVVVVIAAILFVFNWICVGHKLKYSLLIDDSLERWILLQNFRPPAMTHAQNDLYMWYRACTLVMLGSFTTADEVMENLKAGVNKRYHEDSHTVKIFHTRAHYYDGIRAFYGEDTAKAIEAFQKMEVAAQNSGRFLITTSETILLINALVNHGSCLAKRGQYLQSINYFKKALELTKTRTGKKYESSVDIIYYNYILAVLEALPDDQDTVEHLLVEYRGSIDKNHKNGRKAAEELIKWFNIKMYVLHQTGAEHDSIESEIQNFFKKTLNILEERNENIDKKSGKRIGRKKWIKVGRRCSQEQRKVERQTCNFIAGMARIMFTNKLNPSNGLREIKKHFDLFHQLPMPDRFYAFRELDYMFTHLAEIPIMGKYAKERGTVRLYMKQQAEKDIKEYLDTLPMEAVYLRIDCFVNLAHVYSANQAVINAVLEERFPDDNIDKHPLGKHTQKAPHDRATRRANKQKYQKKGFLSERYDLDKTLKFLSSAVDIAQKEGLVFTAYHIKLNMVDEMCALVNSDASGRIKHPEQMRNIMSEIETEYLPLINDDHVAVAEFAIRLSFYHLILGDYDDCMRYYYFYDYKALPTKHFAPWLREQYLLCSWVVRVLCFYRVLIENEAEEALPGESDDIREWFRNWRVSNGREVSMLLAQFLGFSRLVLSTVIWRSKGDKTETIHSWIRNTIFHLEVDLTYGQFKDDQEHQKLFFNQGTLKILDMEYNLGHPMEMGRSYFLKRVAIDGGKFDGIVYNELLEYHPEKEDSTSLPSRLFSLVLNLIDENYPRCPDLEAINKEGADVTQATKPDTIFVPFFQKIG